MEFKTDKSKWTVDGDGAWVCFRADSIATAQEVSSGILPEKTYVMSAKENKKHRSLDANAYFWVLVGKLAAVTKTPKDMIYRQMIKDIGDNFEVVPIKEEHVDHWKEIWSRHGLGWVCDDAGESKIKGYHNMVCYFGSSTYDSAQMSRLIDSAVFECSQLGIETMTPAELAQLVGDWK